MPIKKNKSQDTITINIDALKMKALLPGEDLGDVPTSIKMENPNFEATDFLEIPHEYKIILFDYQNDFFKENKKLFPKGYEYIIVKTIMDLNDQLRTKQFQIVVLNYDSDAKIMNAISGEIKTNLPSTKVIIASKAISPNKAAIHANSQYGASGYYQYPLEVMRLEGEFTRIHEKFKSESGE